MSALLEIGTTATARLLLSCLMLLALLVPAVFASFLLQWSIEVSALAGNPNQGAVSGFSALYEKNHELMQSIEEKAKVTELVLTGQLSLAQAIKEFRRLSDNLERLRPTRTTFAMSKSDEVLAKNVLCWAWSQGSQRPDYTAALHRLEQEMQQILPHCRPHKTTLH